MICPKCKKWYSHHLPFKEFYQYNNEFSFNFLSWCAGSILLFPFKRFWFENFSQLIVLNWIDIGAYVFIPKLTFHRWWENCLLSFERLGLDFDYWCYMDWISSHLWEGCFSAICILLIEFHLDAAGPVTVLYVKIIDLALGL